MKSIRLILLIQLFGLPTFAASFPQSKVVGNALLQVQRDLQNDQIPREEILAKIEQAIIQDPDGDSFNVLGRLRDAIEMAIERKGSPDPLIESHIDVNIVTSPVSYGAKQFERFRLEYPDDPSVTSFDNGANAVDALIGQLSNRAIARTRQGNIVNGNISFPPVSEIAARLIEIITGSAFTLDRKDRREGLKERNDRIRTWWAQNRNQRREIGILDQLEYVRENTTDWSGQRSDAVVWMASNLLMSSEERFSRRGLSILTELVANDRLMLAAERLVEYGDSKPFDLLHERFRDSPAAPSKVFTSSEIQFLLKYGGRPEWEALYILSRLEIDSFDGQIPDLDNGGPNSGGVLPVVVESAEKGPLWTVPFLGLGLTQTNLFDGDSFYADQAREALEEITGKRFKTALNSREAAARRALDWWRKEGSAEYSFEHIDAIWSQLSVDGAQEPLSLARQEIPSGTYRCQLPMERENENRWRRTKKRIDFEIKGNDIVCVDSSDENLIGASGTVTPEGMGRFSVYLQLETYDNISVRWNALIDGNFRITDRLGTAIARKLD